jgi:hypothetical protein
MVVINNANCARKLKTSHQNKGVEGKKKLYKGNEFFKQ